MGSAQTPYEKFDESYFINEKALMLYILTIIDGEHIFYASDSTEALHKLSVAYANAGKTRKAVKVKKTIGMRKKEQS